VVTRALHILKRALNKPKRAPHILQRTLYTLNEWIVVFQPLMRFFWQFDSCVGRGWFLETRLICHAWLIGQKWNIRNETSEMKHQKWNISCEMTYRVAKTQRIPYVQVIFRKRATNYRALLRKINYKDKASCGLCYPVSVRDHLSMMHDLFSDK